MAQNKRKVGTGAGAAAGVGALLAAAAGAYWLYGAKSAPKNRKLARSWMLKARAEVMDRVSKVQNIDRKQYMAMVDSVVAAAGAAGAATRPEAARLARDLRGAWTHIASQLKGKAKKKKGASKKSPAKKKRR